MELKPYKPVALRQLIADVLVEHSLFSLAAVDLLLGTCAHESHMGEYRRQVGGGPALGIMQIEPYTYMDIQHRYSHKHSILATHGAYDLADNDELSILVARLKYLDSPKPLPPVGDVTAQSRYWGKWYQSQSDPQKMAQYRIDYLHYVLGESIR